MIDMNQVDVMGNKIQPQQQNISMGLQPQQQTGGYTIPQPTQPYSPIAPPQQTGGYTLPTGEGAFNQTFSGPAQIGNQSFLSNPYAYAQSMQNTMNQPQINGLQPEMMPDAGGDNTGLYTYDPSWGGNAKPWTQWPSDLNVPENEIWRRDPSWDPHLVWNPYWGWQDYSQVIGEQGYGSGTGLRNWQDFTRHPGGWEQYTGESWYPGNTSGGGGTNGGGTDTGGTFPWSEWMNYMQNQNQSEVPGTYWSEPYTAPQGQGFQYPEQWGQAGNVYNQFMNTTQPWIPTQWNKAYANELQALQTGLPNYAPGEWNTGSEWAQNMMQTGMPTSQDEWYQQAKQIAQTDIEDAIKQASEQAGLSGLRWSTPMGRSAQDIAGRTMANVGLEWTGREMDALEQARQRQMAANQMLYGYGAGRAGLQESAANRRMQAMPYMANLGSMIAGQKNLTDQQRLQAAQLMQGLGSQYLQAPQDWAAQMYQMGTGMQGLQQNAYDRYYQDFLRMTAENNPWLAQAMGFSGLQSQMVPQQYQQSWLSQLLGGASSILPFLFM